MTAVRTDLTAVGHVPLVSDHVVPGGGTSTTPVLIVWTGLRSLCLPGATSAQPGSGAGSGAEGVDHRAVSG